MPHIFNIKTNHPDYVDIKNPITEGEFERLATEFDQKIGIGEHFAYPRHVQQLAASYGEDIPEYAYRWKGGIALIRLLAVEACPKCKDSMYGGRCDYCDI
jgi:hypothetical protein